MLIEQIGLFLLFALGLIVVSRISSAFYLQIQALMVIAGLFLMFIGGNVILTGVSHPIDKELYEYGTDHGQPTLDNITHVLTQQTEKTWPTYTFGLLLIATGVIIATIGLSQKKEEK